MSIKRAFVLLISALSVFASAQAPEPTLTVSEAPKAVAAGSKLTLTVTVSFADGLHGYQNPPAQEFEIPVTVKIDGKEFKLVKAAYPAGIDATVGGGDKPTKTYAGTIKIPITVSVPAKVGAKTLKVVVSYQQCNETACFPPADVTKTIKVNVVKQVKKG